MKLVTSLRNESIRLVVTNVTVVISMLEPDMPLIICKLVSLESTPLLARNSRIV